MRSIILSIKDHRDKGAYIPVLTSHFSPFSSIFCLTIFGTMGAPERQAMLRTAFDQLRSNHRQEATIGALIMCLSTLSAEFLIKNIYSWQLGERNLQFDIQNIYSWQLNERAECLAAFLSGLVIVVAIFPWIQGLELYYEHLQKKETIHMPGLHISARNKGLIYGLGAVNISLVIVIIWPGINERTSFAIKVLPAYIGIVIGNL